MIQRLCITIALLASACCNRQWTRTDTALEATFAAEMAVDTYQTGAIVDACREVNPVIGSCNDRVPYQVYQPVMLLAHAVVSYMLPPNWRRIWQGITVGVEGHQVFVNAEVALHPAQ